MCLPMRVLILFAVAATGYGLRCYICSGFGSDSCLLSPSVASCPDGDVCASRYRISILGFTEFIPQQFDRFCAHPSECNATGTFRTGDSSFDRMATTCCSADLCTPEKPIAPDESSEPNGLQCDKCFSNPSCFLPGSVTCMGDETMCLLETTTKTAGTVTLTSTKNGCASKGICYLGNKNSTSGTVHEETTYSCTPPSGASYNTTPTTLIVLSYLLSLLIQCNKYNV